MNRAAGRHLYQELLSLQPFHYLVVDEKHGHRKRHLGGHTGYQAGVTRSEAFKSQAGHLSSKRSGGCNKVGEPQALKRADLSKGIQMQC